ncbi:MAG: hypothetical protein ABJ215_06750 [Alphaproteobacteria bacterium]
MSIVPTNLDSLHQQEETFRTKALELLEADKKLRLHLQVVESAMNLADLHRQFETEDEDLKVTQILGMRIFNALGASLKLALSGYSQNSAIIMRDILETVFLLDLFRGDRAQIETWRFADRITRMKEFSPAKIRKKLDKRDGFTTKKRGEVYDLFSELAAHPNMKSSWMMRPQKNGDAVIGPFIEKEILTAVLSEMGKLAVQVGEMIDSFLPISWEGAKYARVEFHRVKTEWLQTFYTD